MGPRTRPRVGALLLVVVATGAIVSALPRQAPHIVGQGDPLGGEFAGGGPTILWVVSAGDLLSCRTAGMVLRRVQRARPSPSITLLAVGADTGWAQSFLHAERVRGRVRTVSERRYRATFGRSPTPMIYVLSADRVHAVIPPARGLSRDSQTAAALIAALDTLRPVSFAAE